MTSLKNHTGKIALGAMVLLAFSAIAFAQAPGRVVQKCGNNWTRVWSGQVQIGTMHNGQYPVAFGGGSFAGLNNVLERGCQVEVVLERADSTGTYQCTSATISPLYFLCSFSGSEQSTDATGVDFIENPSIKIMEGVTEAGYQISFNGTAPAGSSPASFPSWVPSVFASSFDTTANVIVFTKK